MIILDKELKEFSARLCQGLERICLRSGAERHKVYGKEQRRGSEVNTVIISSPE